MSDSPSRLYKPRPSSLQKQNSEFSDDEMLVEILVNKRRVFNNNKQRPKMQSNRTQLQMPVVNPHQFPHSTMG